MLYLYRVEFSSFVVCNLDQSSLDFLECVTEGILAVSMKGFTTPESSTHLEGSLAFSVPDTNMLIRYVENRAILCIILGMCGSGACHKESDRSIFRFSF